MTRNFHNAIMILKKGCDFSMYCSNCGKPINDNQAVCLECGVAVKNEKNKLNGQDKLVVILICLFLGEFGIHNFMLGENKKGIFRIIATVLLCGTGWIFALVDLVKIAMDTYEVNPNKLI